MPDTEKAQRMPAPPALSAPVDPARFVEVTGERIALLGREEGPFECWAWPLKLVSDLRFTLLSGGIPLALPEREVTVLAGELRFIWKGPGVQLRTEVFACRERPGLAFGFALDSDVPLELEVTFRCDLRPMWPAGLGGQLARVDRVTGALALSEELGRFAGLIGASDASVELDAADHALPATPVRIRVPLASGGASTVLALAFAEIAPAPLSESALRGGEQAATGFARAERAIAATRELWWRLVSDFSGERELVRAHWRAHQERVVQLATPSPELDEAFRWAQIAIERAWVRVDGLGRGLVAGLAPSGTGERPGYGWFFDGDALAASRALTTSGDFQATRDVLRFAALHQRADGKLMHELTLSARLCRWLEDYPYAYYKGMNSADFVAALDLYVRFSGDLELGRELLPAAKRAIEWAARSVDSDGRLANSRAGIAAVEAGPLADKIESEVFLQGAWIAALGAIQRLCSAAGEDAAPYRALEDQARAGFEAFWDEERGHYGFALLEGGKRCDDLTAYLGYPLARGLGERTRAWASVQRLNRPELMSDWGARMFATDSTLYDPESYNHGAVFPYLTNFVTLALFAHGHSLAAHQVLFAQAALTHRGGLGFVQEHLEGERCVIPRRGVPHQIFSSAALVESTLLGLFGLDVSAPENRVVLRPALPAHWDEARLSGVAVGAARLDLRVYRRRESDATVLGVELEARRFEGSGEGGGALPEIGFAPVLPPLSKLLDGPGWLRPSGAIVPRRVHRSDGAPLTLEARVLEGPTVRLPATLPDPGEPSRAVRLVAQRLEADGLRWTFAGRAGSRAALHFHCDFEVEVAGAELADGERFLAFPPGRGWTELEGGVRAR
jgi:hypothetical protein